MQYSTTVAGDRLDSPNNRLQGLTPAAWVGTPGVGSLVIGDSTLSGATGVLATIPLNTPPFSKSGRVLTLNVSGMQANPSSGGTASKAELRDPSGAVVATGLTVGTTGTDIIIGSTTITLGVPVQVTAGSITHP